MKQINALTIAGTDPSGGAGIQANIKTFSALGVYATSVVIRIYDRRWYDTHDKT